MDGSTYPTIYDEYLMPTYDFENIETGEVTE